MQAKWQTAHSQDSKAREFHRAASVAISESEYRATAARIVRPEVDVAEFSDRRVRN